MKPYPLIFPIMIAIFFSCLLYGCNRSDNYWLTPTGSTLPSTITLVTPRVKYPTSSKTINALNNQANSEKSLTPTPEPLPQGSPEPNSNKAVENCELPCVYGITPGETTWNEVKRLLEDNATISLVDSDTKVRGRDGKVVTYNYYQIQLNTQGKEQIAFYLSEVEGIVDIIYISNSTNNEYKLSSLVRENGIPARVFLTTHSYGIDYPLPISLVIFYEHKNLVAIYSSQHDENHELIEACFEQDGIIIIYDTNQLFTESFLKEFIGDPAFDTILSSEEAMGMTVDEFYEYFREQNTNCITTPASLWP